jgi:SAM-dependent methyltransferase
MELVRGSFRDPAGRLVARQGRLFRLVHAAGAGEAECFLGSAALKRFREAGRVVGTRVVEAAEASALELGEAAIVLEHERIPFASFPSEWAAGMLAAAGGLTLDLSEAVLPEGLGLKDATPYNVLFRGPEPVFVDALSFERRAELDPLWRPQAQFERTFLFPLLAASRCGVPLWRSLGTRREGLEPEEMAALAGPLRRWMPPYLTMATIPARLNRTARVERTDFYRAREARSAEQARFILERQFAGLRRQLRRVSRGRRESAWSDYQGEACHYAAEDQAAKRRFVAEALEGREPGGWVLDIGANLGDYSLPAARQGQHVVAVDSDPVVVDALWRRARAEKADVLPLVVDLAEPTPATGWGNEERPSFLERAEGRFDVVLMLAVVHHLRVTHRIPLQEIVDLAARLVRPGGQVIVEYVGPEDPQFRRLCRGREGLHSGHGREVFEAAWGAQFMLERRCALAESGREVYLLRGAQR